MIEFGISLTFCTVWRSVRHNVSANASMTFNIRCANELSISKPPRFISRQIRRAQRQRIDYSQHQLRDWCKYIRRCSMNQTPPKSSQRNTSRSVDISIFPSTRKPSQSWGRQWDYPEWMWTLNGWMGEYLDQISNNLGVRLGNGIRVGNGIWFWFLDWIIWDEAVLDRPESHVVNVPYRGLDPGLWYDFIVFALCWRVD